jgi:MFS family permease
MSAKKRAEFHEILKEPRRQKILLQLGQHDYLSFDSLLKNLKITDPRNLENQLSNLGDLLEKKYLADERGVEVLMYALTEKGHEVAHALIAFPELAAQDYNALSKPKWFTPYWVALFVVTAIVVGVVIPFFGHQPLERMVFFLVVALSIEGLAFYARIKAPSRRTNRIMYIVLFGAFFGCWLSIAAIVVLSHYGFKEIDAVVIASWAGCFVLGGLLGDLIGRLRHYKGPQRYQL